MTAILTSFIFVLLAEMGDKTQLLAMTFATRYRWQTVLWGVFAATVINHLFAVMAGNYITRLIPISYVQIAAAVSFILFGLWTIRGDELSEDKGPTNYTPFWTVAIAFFLAEMGDKTQLATVALATQFNSVIPVWFGTTLGMIIADGMGIIFGIVLGKKIPERAIKWFAAIIFILFGLFGLYEYLPKTYLSPPWMAGGIALLFILMYLVWRMGSNKDQLPPRTSS